MIKIIFLSLMPFLVFSQGVATVFGEIRDKETGDVLPSVVIDMQYGGYSSSSNAEGKFAFKFPNLVLDSSFVTFSSLGYKTRILPARELMKHKSNEVLLQKAELIETTLGISEARRLVEAAVDSIKRNNIKNNFFQNGFYQESAFIEGIGVVKMKEAVLRVERFPDEDVEYDKIRVTKSRFLDWRGQSAKIEVWEFPNGPAIACRTIETELPEFLTKGNLKDYEFRVDSMQTTYNDIQVYSISFEPKSARLRGGRTGKIFLEPYSKAIIRLEYDLTKRALSDVIGGGSGSIKLKGERLRFVSQYRWATNKWVLHENLLTIDMEYQERLDKEFKAKTHWELRFLASETRELSARMIKDPEVIVDTKSFRTTSGLNPEFWDSYNYIVPTEEMMKLPGNHLKR